MSDPYAYGVFWALFLEGSPSDPLHLLGHDGMQDPTVPWQCKVGPNLAVGQNLAHAIPTWAPRVLGKKPLGLCFRSSGPLFYRLVGSR